MLPNHTQAQCIVVVESASDYEVSIEITITGIAAASPCTFGYNFNVEFDYEVIISGSGAPGSLYTLQGNIECDDYPGNFFDLPNSGGSGSGTSVSNPYNPNTDCLTVTPEILGCDSISIQINGPGIPDQIVHCYFGEVLPISLLSFHATAQKNNTANLNWITASELNNDFFEIEHSTDGANWVVINEQRGAGNSNELIHYNFVDENAKQGINYYRLKQTDFDGQFTYSKVRSVQLNDLSTSGSFIIYPNPANDLITIQANPQELAQVTIYNTFGQLILRNQPNESGANEMTIDVSILPAGIYFVKTLNYCEKLVIN